MKWARNDLRVFGKKLCDGCLPVRWERRNENMKGGGARVREIAERN